MQTRRERCIENFIHSAQKIDSKTMQLLPKKRSFRRKVQEEAATAAHSNSTSANDDTSPILLSTLPDHEQWIHEHADDDVNTTNAQQQHHFTSENKLETHYFVANNNGTTPTATAVSFCHLVSMNPFTRRSGNITSYYAPAYESALATMLAVQMLNTGDDSVISELAALRDNSCNNIQFSIEFVDTEFQLSTALNRVIDITHPYTNKNNTSTTNDEVDDGGGSTSQNDLRLQPCAFLGASRSAVSGPTSIITGLEDFVQISGESTSTSLDDRNVYPRFARSIPSDAGTAEALILFLVKELKLTHLAVLNINDSFGNAYATMIRDAARQVAPDLEILQVPMDHRGDFTVAHEDLNRAVTTLRRSEFL
ncbi:MAG: hypothetical protein SGILL_006335, partial [Bacillariaceae sp.]